jgi:hypothetical protein
MWTCPKCKRIFEKVKQQHSCHKVALVEHFKNKKKAKELFDFLVKEINNKIGKCKIISIPCCVHLFGKYDFLAALPKKDKLEIRFALDKKLSGKRIKIAIPVSVKYYKNCLEIKDKKEIDAELMKWLKDAYSLKENN